MYPYKFAYAAREESGRNYINLEPLRDDKTVLKNPHKGWYWHYIDNGYKRDNYRVNHDPNDHIEDFQGFHHLYLRFDWGDVEKVEGRPDWSYIDSIMDEWSRYGYKFSFRMCTYEGAGNMRDATPEYVYAAGAKGIELTGGRLEPVYDDPIYLEKLEAFMRLFGEKYDGDSRVEFVDVGSFGTWGEGHTGNGSERLYPASTVIRHMDMTARAFPHKHILLNDDHVNNLGVERDPQGGDAIIDRARALGFGLRDDSVCVEYYSRTFNYDTLRTGWLFDEFSGDAPVDIEFEHYASMKPDVFADGFPFLDALRRTRATYAGFHGYPRPWLEKNRYFTEYVANRLGYWYFVPRAELLPMLSGARGAVSIWFENSGFARAYDRFELTVALAGDRGEYRFGCEGVDNRRWLPGTLNRERIPLDLAKVPAGDYEVRIGLRDGETPVKLGIKQAQQRGADYAIGRVKVD